MTNLTQLSPDDITTSQHLQARYDAFKARGLKLDLTRGKSSAAQLDLSSALLSFLERRTTSPRTARIAAIMEAFRAWRKCADYSPD